jgi:hypothetical protein
MLFSLLNIIKKKGRHAMARMCNVGGVDRTARMSIGAALLGTGIFSHLNKPLRVAMGALGAMGLTTALMRYCPVSKAFGKNTCELTESVQGS